MSIIISNITDLKKNPKIDGIHKYEVRINDRLICEFTHTREEGLSKCLHLAAEAVARDGRKYELMALENFLVNLKELEKEGMKSNLKKLIGKNHVEKT